MPAASVIPLPLASSVICVVTQSWELARPDLDEASFMTANFMAAELLGPSDVSTGNTEFLKSCRIGIAVT
jgi:hypothetical protein